MQARTSANGPSSSVRKPLPRTPPNDTPSNSTPCCGTSFASMPSRVPSQNTRAPRADELRRDGEPREHVAAGAAGGDHHGRAVIGAAPRLRWHSYREPRSRRRFS